MADMTKNPDLERVYACYERGNAYKQRINLFETVKQNENFFLGRQWEGVNAPDLEKPVNNIIRRIVTYAISQLVSDSIAVEVRNKPNDPMYPEPVLDYLNKELEHVMEQTKFTSLSRDWIRDAAVDGDACAYFYWDAEAGYPGMNKGAIVIEAVDNTRVIFGAPAVSDVQKQPYIIIPSRQLISTLKRMAKNNKLSTDDIKADLDETEQPNVEQLDDDHTATLLTYLWRNDDTDTVWACQSTKTAWIRKPWDTGLKLYPVAFFSWDKVKNCYHGQAIVSSVIHNQIAINKLQAMLIKGVKDMAFPKIVYDATKIDQWSNRVGEAIATIGDPNQAVARVLQGAAITPQVQQLIDSLMALTKDTMGASDAALGNVRPENTSAIIAIQKAASAPLELQRQSYYQFCEDSARVLVDMMRNYYGERPITVTDPATGFDTMMLFDFGQLEDAYRMITVNVGASAYWSELTQVQTADNMLQNGLIDGETYIEQIPDTYIKNKQKVDEYVKQQAALRAQQMQMQMTGGAPIG